MDIITIEPTMLKGEVFLPPKENDLQAAFFLVAGALGCDMICYGLSQPECKILDILKEVGAEVAFTENGGIRAYPTATMKGTVVDAREIPDLVPILAVLLGFCKGESRIINAGRLRMEESDCLASIAAELKRLGLSVTEGSDYLKIYGKQVLCGETVSARNDGRIAMALAVAACRCEGPVTLLGAQEAVKESFPDFFDIYRQLQNGPKTLLKFGEIISCGRKRKPMDVKSKKWISGVDEKALQRRDIILIGMPGCGKSSIGKKIAKMMHRPFLDLDEAIVRKAGKSIPEIFSEDGEAVFRAMETDCFRESIGAGSILATGGGIVTRRENLDIAHKGTVVFLDRPIEAIMNDVDTSRRPLLADGKEKLLALYQERYSLYKEWADLSVVNDGEMDEITRNLIKEVENYENNGC